MAEMELKTVSTVDAVAQAIRERIFDGTLAPGERLREVAYARELGVARHSFRAATAALIHEGLLRRSRNRGVHVPMLGAGDIDDIFRLRAALELEAVRVLMAPRAARWRPDELEAAVDDLSALGDEAPWRLVVDGDMHFHRALIEAAGNSRLLAAYTALQSEILLCIVQQRPLYASPAELAAEHRELLGAIEGGDLTLADRVFRAHLDEAAGRLTARLVAEGAGATAEQDQPIPEETSSE